MNKVPEGWKIQTIGELGEIVTGSTPPTNDLSNYGKDILFVSPFDMNGQKYIKNTNKMLSEKGFKLCRPISKESVMVTCIASIGKLAISSKECATNQQINSVICNQWVENHYLFYYLQNYPESITSLSGKTAVPIVNKTQFSSINILLPPLPEQKKIAEILSSVDRSIEATEKLIAKLTDLKKALMQELFTKGIGHTKFKDSPLGRIPEEWEVLSLKDIARVGYGLGQSPKFVINGVPFIRATDIHDGLIYGDKILFINSNDVPKNRDVKLKEGDIIVVRSGAYTGDIGYVTQEWESKMSVCGYDLKVTPSSCNPKFLCYWLLSEKTQKLHFELERSRSAQPHLNSEQVENTPIIFPKPTEQSEIASILSSNDSKIEKAKSRLNKLQDMKKGLMQDLLTGKVRTLNAESRSSQL